MTHSKKKRAMKTILPFFLLLTNWYMGTLPEKKERKFEPILLYFFVWLPLIIILLCLPFHFFGLNNKKKTLNIFALNRMNGYGICIPDLTLKKIYSIVMFGMWCMYVWMCLFWTWVVDYYHCCWLKMTRIIYHLGCCVV